MFDGEEVSEAVALADPKKLLAFYASSVEHPEFHFERDIEIIKSVWAWALDYFSRNRGLPVSMSIPLNKVKE